MRQNIPQQTPSLVGDSVRNVDDTQIPDLTNEPIDHVNSSLVLNKIQPQDTSVDGSYTTVAELNREGALLTDEMDMDQVVNATEKDQDDPDEHRRFLKLLKKKQLEQPSSKSSVSPQRSIDSKSLVTATDPIEDQISISPSQRPRGRQTDPTIRNSYGEFIRDESHRPHLARGQSYQKGTEEERPGRRTARSLDKDSRDYLRSLSRSLSRDPARRRNPQVSTGTESGENLDNARLYSTNNYSISQADLENAPHIIQTLQEEPEEPSEGVLKDDQGNEEFPADMEEAAQEARSEEARRL
ncbi:YLR257W [Zygosaccharomyces parabailii]|nr:YLR257W [Zygosaccharomyces parabailii]CDH11675.1 uncharacterized protein ZBAI_03461 [Zygosaccharomyces bailii ISA1307]